MPVFPRSTSLFAHYDGDSVTMLLVTIMRLQALAILCIASLCASAEPLVQRSVTYYDIEADTLGTLQLMLESEVPIRPSGKLYHGYTHSRVDWQWQLKKRGHLCYVHKVKTLVDVEITLPRLRKTRKGSEVERVWEKWYPALERHEQQHANNALIAAQRGESRLLALRPRADCSELKQAAQSAEAKAREALLRLDRDYDLRTAHGETEGASLLPYVRAARNAPAARSNAAQQAR